MWVIHSRWACSIIAMASLNSLGIEGSEPAADDASAAINKVKERLFKNWRHVETINAGKRIVVEPEDAMVYQYRPHGVSQYLFRGEISPFGIYDKVEVDATADPMRMTLHSTLTGGKRRTSYRIFKFDGRRLITVAAPRRTDWPSGFTSTAENGYVVSIYEPELADAKR